MRDIKKTYLVVGAAAAVAVGVAVVIRRHLDEVY